MVAPLNWGLGHATRCVPVIAALLSRNVRVIIGGDGRSLALLRHEFPHLPVIELPSYDITYPVEGGNMAISMSVQIPKILSRIQAEQDALKRYDLKFGFDAVISDNRYGCYLKGKPSVFMTHQLFIQTPGNLGFLSPLLWQLNQFFIRRFSACWIPDLPDPVQNLSGNLSHTRPLSPARFRFIGPLSRMSKDISLPVDAPIFKAAVVLSGPEPQRTIFEEIVLKQAASITDSIAIVRGLTETNNEHRKGNLYLTDHLTTEAINRLLLRSEVVIARSGYSTLMDLAAIGKKAALVPTPGQTEQEYLAGRSMELGLYYSVAQQKFDLLNAMTQAVRYSGLLLDKKDLLTQAVESLIVQIQGQPIRPAL